MQREIDRPFDFLVETFRELDPEVQKALMLRSIGVPDAETCRDLNTDSLYSLYQVRNRVKKGFQFLATKKPDEIREIVKAVYPQEYEKELTKRKLVELDGSLFNREEMELMAKLALGATPRDLAGDENYSTVTSRLSNRLYKRLGIKNGKDGVKHFMFIKFPHLVRRHAEKNGQLMVGETIFSAHESILIYEALTGLNIYDMGRSLGMSPEETESTVKTICEKLGAKNIREVVERARESYPTD